MNWMEKQIQEVKQDIVNARKRADELETEGYRYQEESNLCRSQGLDILRQCGCVAVNGEIYDVKSSVGNYLDECDPSTSYKIDCIKSSMKYKAERARSLLGKSEDLLKWANEREVDLNKNEQTWLNNYEKLEKFQPTLYDACLFCANKEDLDLPKAPFTKSICTKMKKGEGCACYPTIRWEKHPFPIHGVYKDDMIEERIDTLSLFEEK